MLKRVKDIFKPVNVNKSSKQPKQPTTISKTVEPKEAMDVEANVTEAVKAVDKQKYTRLYIDETFVTFFRRLGFSPDGSLLFAPAGIRRNVDHSFDNDSPEFHNCVHIYARNAITK